MPDHGQRTGAQFLHAVCTVQKCQEFTQTTGDLHCDSSLRGVRAGPVRTLTQSTLLGLAVITTAVAPCSSGHTGTGRNSMMPMWENVSRRAAAGETRSAFKSR